MNILADIMVYITLVAVLTAICLGCKGKFDDNPNLGGITAVILLFLWIVTIVLQVLS